MKRQTPHNWQAEGCQNYDDAQDICLDDDVVGEDCGCDKEHETDFVEAGFNMNLSPEGSAKGRVKERKRLADQKWLEDAILQAAKDMYDVWKRRGGREPNLTTSLLRDLAIEGTGGLPEDIKWMSKRQQDLAVLNALQKLKRKGLMEVSTGMGQRGGEAKVWNPVSAAAETVKTARGTVIKRHKGKVGKLVGPQLYVHKKYASEVVPLEKLAAAAAALQKHGAFPYNSIMFDSKKDVVRFDEAPDFDTAREPRVGRYISVNLADGSVKEGKSDSIWHHKWLWVKDDYPGFDVDASKTWSATWAPALPEVAKGTERTFLEQLKKHNIAALLLAMADYFDPDGEVAADFKRPHDGWKGLKTGVQPLPQPLEGHERAWAKIATRLGINGSRGVTQLAPVIGGRRRYHHRPLTSWLLPDKKTTLTLTTDKLEGQSWNRLKNKRHPAMPRVSDVFELRLTGVRASLWAIVHERLTWPVDPDWDVFVDTFFRWRAMQKDALKPAQPEDLEGFLRFIIDPEKSDPVTVRRRRVETALPFKMMNDRRADIAARRRAVWKDAGLQQKIAWAKSTLKFLRANKVRHRDLDPSNLAKTLKGRTVVTNVAESRSKGTKIGRVGRVSSAADPVAHDPFGPTPAAPALRTAQAINMLLDPEAPLMEQLQILSTETRNLNMQIHQDADMRAAVQEAAFKVGYPQDTILRGLEKLTDLAERSGGKAAALAETCLAKLAPTMSLPPPPTPESMAAPLAASADGWTVVKAAGWRRVKTPEQRSQAAQKAAKTRKARQVPVEVKINGIPVTGAYYPSYNGKVDESYIYFSSRAALRKLADLPMVKVSEMTDDYAHDNDINYGKGQKGTLGALLARRPQLVNLSLDRPGSRYDGRVGWFMHVSPHMNESWDSGDPVEVMVRKTEAPAPVELPPMPKMVASTNFYKKKRRVRRASKMKKIVDTLVNVAEYLED